MNTEPTEFEFLEAFLRKCPDVREKWRICFAVFQRLFAESQERRGVTLSAEQDILAFAGFATGRELQASGENLQKTVKSVKQSKFWLGRLFTWMAARARMHELLARKICPGQYDPTADIAQASWAGFLASNRETANEVDVIEFLASARNQRPQAFEAFRKAVANPQKAAWSRPELDCWLVCIWPAVVAGNWRFRDVWALALRRFEDSEGGPFESAQTMRKHCLLLGLEAPNRKAGRPGADAEFSPPNGAEIALAITAELPPNMRFWKIGK